MDDDRCSVLGIDVRIYQCVDCFADDADLGFLRRGKWMSVYQHVPYLNETHIRDFIEVIWDDEYQ